MVKYDLIIQKVRKKRYVQLYYRLILTYEQMKIHYNEHPTEDIIKYYSKQFQKALRCLGIKNERLHSLRHTYFIRRLIQTNGNIFLVRDELGHKNVSPTEKYSKIDIKRLENDFPSLFKLQSKSWTKSPILDTNFLDKVFKELTFSGIKAADYKKVKSTIFYK